MTEPLTLTVQRVLAREPEIVVVKLAPDLDCVDVVVIIDDRTWELWVLPEALDGFSRPVGAAKRLQAWIGGNATPIGPIVDPRRSLVDRLTPVRMYTDLALPVGNRVIFDERDHVTPAVYAAGYARADGIVIDEQPDEGTVDVILLTSLKEGSIDAEA